MKQFEGKVDQHAILDLEEGYEQGFKILRNFIQVNPTALEVAEQYYYSKKKNYLTKENEANHNNRWLQFRGDFRGQFKYVAEYMKQHYGTSQSHIYANWKQDGHHYGRHKDQMDVIIVQMWNEVAYCVESPYGENKHHSYSLRPGDAIYIRNGTWHTPVVFGERATMSFSWG